MNTSRTGLTLIAEFEGFRSRPYKDSGGRWTIGFGHLIKTSESFTSLTYAQAEALLARDIAAVDNALASLVHVGLTQNEYDALASLVFNIGSGNFLKSTLLKFLNAGDYAQAANCFLSWIMVGGQPSAGLRRRRLAEQKLFLTK